MTTSRSLLPADVSERVLATSPLPIADAFGALVAADSAFEQRDRVVEVFRATLRTLAAFTLAARVQFGPGPGAESAQIAELIRSLRSRGLTDGQWFAIVREMLRPWAGAPGSHPLSALVSLVHGKKAELPKLIDELLVMRKSETVAHGASGTKAAIGEILERRVPQLLRLLALLEPLFSQAKLAVPLATPADEGEAQSAWSLVGYTPPRGRWRRCALAEGVRLAPGEAVLLDQENKPIVALHPIVLVRRPSPEAVEELFTLDGGSKKGAVFVALPSMAEHRETEAWAALSKALSDDEAAPVTADVGAAERPFRGLSSFGPEHAGLFFGREEQAESLANRIRRHALVTVTGPSGSGKTSLLRAGALSQLGDYRTVVLRPGAAPAESLAHRLAEGLGPGFTEAEIGRRIREDPASLRALVTEWSRRGADPSPLATEAGTGAGTATEAAGATGAVGATGVAGAVYRALAEATTSKLVVVVDQAEEVFTLCNHEEKREAFGRALASLGASPDSPCRVVLSVREDFFGRFATLASLRGLYSQAVEVVTTPDREALARTLYLPAKQFGYAFEDESLVTTMVDAVASEPAALALLQFCADRLWDVRDRTWKRLSWDAYRALGGVEGALAAHADRTLGEMSGAEARAARSLMMRLVTGERTRATASREELLESAASRQETESVLDRLIAARLLTVGESDDGKDARVEIVHEALIRHWGRLAGWLAEDVEGQRMLHAMRQAAKEWDARGWAKGLLWSGEALLDLRRWRKRSSENLAGVEAAFFDASEAEERRGRRLRRALTAGAFVATGAFGAFMFWQWRAAESARLDTERAQVRAEVRGLLSEAHNMEPSGKTGKALALLRAATALEDATIAGSTPVAGSASVAGSATVASLEMERLARSGAAALVLAGHTAQVRRVAVSPDRSRVLTAAPDGAARLWDVASGALLHTLAANGERVRGIAFAPDGKTLATAASPTAASTGTLRLWDAATGALVRSVDLPVGIGRVAFSPDGALLFVVLDEGGVALFQAATGERAGTLGGAQEGAEEAALSPDGKRLATLEGSAVRVYDVERRALASRFQSSSGQVMDIAFSPDGGLLGVTAGRGVALVDPASGAAVRTLETPDLGTHENGKLKAIRALAFSADGKLVAGGGMDSVVYVWDAATGQSRYTLFRHTDEVTAVAFSADAARLVSASMDGTAAVWDMASGALAAHLVGHEAEIFAAQLVTPTRVVTASYDRTARLWPIDDSMYSKTLTVVPGGVNRSAISGDRGRLAVAGDREVRVLDARTGAVIAEIPRHEEQISAMVLSRDGARVVTGTTEGQSEGAVRIWDVAPARLVATLAGHGKGVTSLALSDDRKRLATGAVDGSVRLWDAESGARTAELPPHGASVSVLSFSRDGARLASGARDGSVAVWDVPGAKRLASSVSKDPVMGLLFAPDGRTLVTAQDTEVRLRDAATGEVRAALGGYEQAVLGMAFSPDGATLAALASDGVARLWTFPEGKPIRDLRSPVNGGYDVAFSPDGERLFVAGGDGQVFVWHVATGLLLERLNAAAREPGLSVERVAPIGGDQALTVARDGSVMLFRAPPADRARALLATGEGTNYRVCRKDFRVVPVSPRPPADSVWAPEAQCGDEGPASQPTGAPPRLP